MGSSRARDRRREGELITAREDASRIVEPQESYPSEGVRGIVEETPRKRDDDDRIR